MMTPPPGSWMGLAFRRALLLGMVSALLMVASIIWRDEIWNDRAVALIGIWMLGGFFGAIAAAGTLKLAARFFGMTTVKLMHAIAFLPAFIVAGAFFFSIQTAWQTGFYLNPDHMIRSLIFGNLQVMALFVYSLSHYMLPWMGPAMVIAGYALLPSPSRRRDG
jgi:hypothetical protein